MYFEDCGMRGGREEECIRYWWEIQKKEVTRKIKSYVDE
jgi:hypothetical protein